MKNTCVQRAAVICLLGTSFLFAQTSGSSQPPQPPTAGQMVSHRVTRLATILTLTSDQQTQATSIFTASQTAIAGFAMSLRSARTALQTAVLANDTGAISTQAGQIGTLTTQTIEAQSGADAALYAILTPDQQTKYKTILSQDPGLLGGPGGPAGPAGHGGHGGPPSGPDGGGMH